jgi:hypothetical protein
MPFDKFLESFDPSVEGFDVEKFKTDALAEYAKDQEAANAKISTTAAERDALQEKVLRVQSHNYDLLQAQGLPNPGGAPGAAGKNEEPSGPRSFDSLFKKE